MRSLFAAFVIAALCATPVSLRWSDSAARLSPAFDSAVAAELDIPVRHHHHHRHYAANYYGYYYGRTYDRFCDGPYLPDGFNGGIYYGGPWIDLRCFGYVY